MRQSLAGFLSAVSFCGFLALQPSAAQAAGSVHVAPKSGVDTGACPNTAPCRTLAYALTQVSPTGFI